MILFNNSVAGSSVGSCLVIFPVRLPAIWFAGEVGDRSVVGQVLYLKHLTLLNGI
jgi:hypothetical protein